MTNITLSIDEELLKLGREYARTQNLSFNVLVRRLVEQTVTKKDSQWLDATFEYIDENVKYAEGSTW
ncbi:MAG: hypothetical protein WCL21_20070, partial [Mariniphaga sp.]